MATEPPEETPPTPEPGPEAGPAPAPAPEPAPEPAGGMVARIRAILFTPKEAFAEIDAEPMTVPGILAGWAAPLAAVGPVAGAVGALIFGGSILGVHWSPSTNFIVTEAVSGWVMGLISLFLFGLLINALAPGFGGRSDLVSALKASAFGSTAGMLGGVVLLVPMLGPLIWLAYLYTLYLLWVALSIMMKVPEEKVAIYLVVAIICWVVLAIVAGAIVNQLTMTLAPPPPIGSATFQF